jgi:ATP-dependent Clp protease adaptor protein ClpS
MKIALNQILSITSSDDDVKGPGSSDGSDTVRGTGLIVEKSRAKPKRPPLYKVLLLNDDYTPMEFVVMLLIQFFGMSQDQAEQVMIHVHTKGVGVCGVFPREIAETKVRLVMDFAGENKHPLQCTLEQE